MCGPNLSDGRDPEWLSTITDAIESGRAFRCSMDPAASTTDGGAVVGDPDATVEAAFRGLEKRRN